MSIVNTLSLESNRQIKINFDGGDLSSDAGLLLLKEFAAKIGFTKLIKSKFKTNTASTNKYVCVRYVSWMKTVLPYTRQRRLGRKGTSVDTKQKIFCFY